MLTEQLLEEKNNRNKKSLRKWYDLSADVSERSVIFPGDPTYKAEKICSMDEGDIYNLSCIHMGNHTGTHIDYPSHVLNNKKVKTSSDFSINQLMGSGIIIEVPNDITSINRQFILKQPILKKDIVFFKTSNSNLPNQGKFYEKYVYLEPNAAEALLEKKVKIVGIDYINIDRYDTADLLVHKILLAEEVLIVEGLNLKDIPIGRCEIIIMPLKIPNMDGLPARVIANISYVE